LRQVRVTQENIGGERLSRFVSGFPFWPEASSRRGANRARGADDGHHYLAFPPAHGEAGGIDLRRGRVHGSAISTLIHSGTSLVGETLSRWIGDESPLLRSRRVKSDSSAATTWARRAQFAISSHSSGAWLHTPLNKKRRAALPRTRAQASLICLAAPDVPR